MKQHINKSFGGMEGIGSYKIILCILREVTVIISSVRARNKIVTHFETKKQLWLRGTCNLDHGPIRFDELKRFNSVDC